MSKENNYTVHDIQPSSQLTSVENKKNLKKTISYLNPNPDKLINYSERNGIDIDVIIKNKEVIKTKPAKIIFERISLNLYYIFIEMMNETFKYSSEINEQNCLVY
mgnify:FL=1